MVSIILTSFNRREFLRESLQTLAEQDYVGTKQLILCDDGSTDGSLEMAQQFRLDFDDFQIVQPPLGEPTMEQRLKEVRYAKLINVALPLCTEKYITYATDDDLYHPERLRKMVEFLETRPDIYLVYHFMKIFRVTPGTREQGTGNRIQGKNLSLFPCSCSLSTVSCLLVPIWDLCHEWNPATEYWVRNIWNLIDHSSLMHKNLVNKTLSLEGRGKGEGENIKWDDDPCFMRCGDWGFLLRALEAKYKFGFIPEYLAIGRKIEGQSLHFDGAEKYIANCVASELAPTRRKKNA